MTVTSRPPDERAGDEDDDDLWGQLPLEPGDLISGGFDQDDSCKQWFFILAAQRPGSLKFVSAGLIMGRTLGLIMGRTLGFFTMHKHGQLLHLSGDGII